MTETVTDKIQNLIEGKRITGLVPKFDSLKKAEEIKIERRGGARYGSGRKPTYAAELRRTHLKFIRDHANELMTIHQIDKRTGKSKTVKITRLAWVLEKLMQQVQDNNTAAMHEYLDRVLGKATQPVVSDEEEPIVLRIDF